MVESGRNFASDAFINREKMYKNIDFHGYVDKIVKTAIIVVYGKNLCGF